MYLLLSIFANPTYAVLLMYTLLMYTLIISSHLHHPTHIISSMSYHISFLSHPPADIITFLSPSSHYHPTHTAHIITPLIPLPLISAYHLHLLTQSCLSYPTYITHLVLLFYLHVMLLVS